MLNWRHCNRMADPLVITGTPVTVAVVDEPYPGFSATASGGNPPYRYSLASGSGPLPDGIALNRSTGEVSGTPTVPGYYPNIIIQVEDSGSIPVLPTEIIPTSLNIVPEVAVGMTRSPFAFAQQAQVHPGQTWHMSVTWPPLNEFCDASNELIAFLVGLKGRSTVFLAGPMRDTRGAATGAPTVKGSGQTGETLVTQGWTPNTAAILKANDHIQLGWGSAARLYRVLSTVASDENGEATLSIYPRLRVSPGDNDPVYVHNPVGQWRLKENIPDISGSGMLYDVQIEAWEAI